MQGGIKVKEPIYDWSEIKKNISKKLKFIKNKNIKFNEEVKNIIFKKKYLLKTNKNNYEFDIVIDASYEGSNRISGKISKKKNLFTKKLLYMNLF